MSRNNVRVLAFGGLHVTLCRTYCEGGRIIPTVVAPSSDRSSSRFAILLQVSTKFSHGVPLHRVTWVCLVVVTRMQAGNTVEYSSTAGAREDLRQ
jgi:hypothetical protein